MDQMSTCNEESLFVIIMWLRNYLLIHMRSVCVEVKTRPGRSIIVSAGKNAHKNVIF